jgi:hypothetical protein
MGISKNLLNYKIKMLKSEGLFDEVFRKDKLKKLGDPLEKLNEAIHWRIFRNLLEKAMAKSAKGPGGRCLFTWEYSRC